MSKNYRPNIMSRARRAFDRFKLFAAASVTLAVVATQPLLTPAAPGFLETIIAAIKSGTAAAPTRYKIADLGTLGGNESYANAINDNGQITGFSQKSSGQHNAFLYQNGNMQNLGAFHSNESFGIGINSSGKVVGHSPVNKTYNDYSSYSSSYSCDCGFTGCWTCYRTTYYSTTYQGTETHAALFNGGSLTDLGSLGTYTNSYTVGGYSNANSLTITNTSNHSAAMDINDSEQIAGYSVTSDGGTRGFIYQNGNMTDIGTLGGSRSLPAAINNAGHLVGISQTTGNQQENAFVYDSINGMRNLGTFGGNYSYAIDINNSGQIVGYAAITNGQLRAFVYDSASGMRNLGTLGGDYSYARGINNAGQIVGSAHTTTNQPQQSAFIYDSVNGMQNLNNLIDESGWNLVSAEDINSSGQIVGYGFRNGQYRAFLLTPITNTAPVAKADSFSTNEDTSLAVNSVLGVLANDTDAEDDPMTVTVVSPPANAANFNLNSNGSFTYTPKANFNGSDSFTYKADDGQIYSNVVTATITVNPVNDAPTVNCPAPPAPVTYTPPGGVSVPVSFVVTDQDKDELTVTWKVNGTVVAIGSGGGGNVTNPISLSHSYNAGTHIVEAVVSDGIVTTPTASCSISVTVNKAPQTITNFDVISGKTYGDAPFPLYATASSGLPVAFQVVSGSATISGNMLTIHGAGVIKVKAVQAGNNNYNPAAPEVERTFTVAKATPIVNWNNPADIVYGTALSNTQLNAAASFKNSLVAGNFAYTPLPGTVLNGGDNQTLSVNFTPTDAANFNSAQASVSINVKKANLAIKADDKSRIYGSAAAGFTITPTGLVNGDTVASLGGSLAFNFADAANKPAGAYTITPSGLTSNNYNITFQNGTLTVGKAALTVRTNNASKTYGAVNPTFSPQFNGFVSGENSSVLSGTLGFNTTAVQSSPAGDYAVTPFGLTSNNYEISFVAGTLTINRAALIVRAEDKSKTYGGTAVPFTAVYTGLVNGDTPQSLSGLLFNFADAPTTPAGTHTIIPSGVGSPNYTVTFQNGTLTVSKVSLNVTADNKTRTYNTAPVSFTVTPTGFVNGETLSSLGGSLAFNFTDTANKPPGVYTIVPSGLTSNNYNITFQNGTLTIVSTAVIGKGFAPARIQPGGKSTVTLYINNGNNFALTNASFTDNLVNMKAAGGAVGGTCQGTTPNALAAGETNLGFSGITIPAGGACTVTYAVTSNTTGTHPNFVSGVTANETSIAGAVSNVANLTVTAPPSITKTFSPSSVAVGANSTLFFTITNPSNNVVALTAVGVEDVFPAGITVAEQTNITSTCASGSVTPLPENSGVFIAAATIAVNSSCTFSVNVKAVIEGSHASTTAPVTSSNGGDGNQASATLNVGVRSNVALASNGGVATASSQFSVDNAPGKAIDGSRTFANGGSWKDVTANFYPDWLQIDFAGSKTISEIDVYAVKDDFSNPSEPNENSVFSIYGITSFDVQYWDGANWTTVPGGAVASTNKVITKLVFAPITASKIRVTVNNAQANFSRIVEVEAWADNGTVAPTPTPAVTPTATPTSTPTPAVTPTPIATPTPGERTNAALAANGAVAQASSYLPNGAPSIANDGIRNWATSGAWKDSTPDNYPDVLEINFSGSKRISEIDVYAVKDDFTNPADPTENSRFNLYGITNFEVQYWNGASWTTVPNGYIPDNNKVITKLVFPAITTNAVRVVVKNAQANHSRIVELEAWTEGSGATPTPDVTPSARINVALGTNGSVATASSQASNGAPGIAIDGVRNWATSGAWKDATPDAHPDWLQVDFAGSKTIGEIDVYAVKDNYSNPSDPTEIETFGVYGITDFEVQYWNGSSWIMVPNGNVAGNNRVITKLIFASITTTKIRVLVSGAQANYSRIVELEAWSN